MLGRPTPVAVRPVPVFEYSRPVRRRRLPGQGLAVAAVVAAILATAALAVRPGGTPQAPPPGPSDVSPPQPVTGLAVRSGRTLLAKPGLTVTWNAATDDVGVTGYEVYVDGALEGQTGGTNFVITRLECGRSVSVGVDAFDGAANRSSITSVEASTGRC